MQDRLLGEHISFTLDTTDYLPQGWNTLSGNLTSPADHTALSSAALPEVLPALWFAESGLLSASGQIDTASSLVPGALTRAGHA